MKFILILLTTVFITTTGFSQKYRFEQNFKLEELNAFIKADVYIGLSTKEEINNSLRLAIKNNWNITEIAGEDSIKAIKDRISNGENLAYIGIVEVLSNNLFSDRSGVDAKSKTYALQLNKDGGRFGFFHQYLCYAEGFDDNSDLSISVGVKMLNSKLKTIEKKKIKKSKKIKDHAQSLNGVFSSKTLYIPIEWLEDDVQEEFEKKYDKNIKFVSLEEFIEGIQNEKEDMIFALPLAVPAEGGFVNTHVFTEAEGFKYLGLCQRLTMMEMQTNIFKSYYGKIEKRHAKLYKDVARGKW